MPSVWLYSTCWCCRGFDWNAVVSTKCHFSNFCCFSLFACCTTSDLCLLCLCVSENHFTRPVIFECRCFHYFQSGVVCAGERGRNGDKTARSAAFLHLLPTAYVRYKTDCFGSFSTMVWSQRAPHAHTHSRTFVYVDFLFKFPNILLFVFFVCVRSPTEPICVFCAVCCCWRLLLSLTFVVGCVDVGGVYLCFSCVLVRFSRWSVVVSPVFYFAFVSQRV